MSLRAINQIVIHLQSFRNIQLWYQGLYFISISLYYQDGKNKIYAHPFAHTQNFHPLEQSKQLYDQQIIRTSFIDQQNSKFISKSFIVKYYEQEIQLNDICHFRIQWDLNHIQNATMILQAQLFFCDINKKGVFQKLDEKQKQLTYRQAKLVKKKKYFVFNSLKGIHQYCPILFDQNYFSLVNSTIHSICLDYRFRITKLQLSQFSRLTYNQKMRLIEINKSLDQKKISYYYSIIKDLNLPDRPDTLKVIQATLIYQMKKNYQILLHSYTSLFGKVISQNQRRIFGNRLISPNNLSLFEDQKIMGKRQSLNQQKIFSKYRSRNPEQIIERMLDQVNHISSQLIKLWHCYIDLFKISPRFSLSCLQHQFIQKKRQFWKKLIFVNRIKTYDISIGVKDNIDTQKLLINEKLKTKISLHVQQQNFVQRRQNLPVFLYNIYQTEQKKSMKVQQNNGGDEGIHLVVFVHGFQGNSFDMRVIKNYVSYLYPESMFLCATSNQQMTQTDILQMGIRLATQIKTYIIQNFPQNTLGRLSFIGHSLGGLKIRACLPHLLDYKDKFHCLITFSSPHLGYGINTSSVVGAGLWVLKKMKDSECLKQLSMTDNENLEETCLFKLSKMQGIQHFKHIFLFSSRQDSYAPLESARIQINNQFPSSKGKQIHSNMVRNILNNVKSGVLRRINVVFKIDQKNLDSLIGRTAHIMFLENQDLMRALLYTQPDLLA